MKPNIVFLLNQKKEDFFEIANEAVNKIDIREKEYSLLEKYYPVVASFLPSTEKILLKHISQYRDKYISILSSPYPVDYPKWNKPMDEAVLFKCTNTDADEVRKDILNVKLPEGVVEKKNFLPFPTIMLFVMRYYLLSKQSEKFKIMCSYLAYSMYWSIFTRQFRPYLPKEEVMIYTVNNLSNKFNLKKFSSIDELLYYTVETTMDTYNDRLINLSDSEVWYIIDQVKTRLSNSIKKITDEYMKNYKNKDNIMFNSTDIVGDDGTQRLDSSISGNVESLANAYTSEFFASSPDISRIKTSATLAGVSASELKTALYMISSDDSVEEIKTFYESLFYIYLTSGDPAANVGTIKSPKFLSVMRSIFKKGNSTDKNIVKVRELMDKWLERGSNTYRATNRQGTMNDYRLGIYYYFILSVTSNK